MEHYLEGKMALATANRQSTLPRCWTALTHIHLRVLPLHRLGCRDGFQPALRFDRPQNRTFDVRFVLSLLQSASSKPLLQLARSSIVSCGFSGAVGFTCKSWTDPPAASPWPLSNPDCRRGSIYRLVNPCRSDLQCDALQVQGGATQSNMVTRLDDYNDRAGRPKIFIVSIVNITFVLQKTAPPWAKIIEIKGPCQQT